MSEEDQSIWKAFGFVLSAWPCVLFLGWAAVKHHLRVDLVGIGRK